MREPQSQPYPKEFKAHIMRVIESIVDADQVTDKAYVDALFALVSGALVYQGTWDASTNTPTLADGTGTTGHFYAVTVSGTQDLGSGNITFTAGDRVIHNGTIWQKWDTNDVITSVFTRTGDIVANVGDYTHAQIGSVGADDHHLEDTIARQSSGYYVSTAKGNDGYTGTEKRPFKTAQAALTASKLAGNFLHRLFFDTRTFFESYTLVLAAGFDYVVCEGNQTAINITTHTGACVWCVHMDATIQEHAAQSGVAVVELRGGTITEVLGVGGAGNPTQTDLTLTGVLIGTGSGNLMTHLDNTFRTQGVGWDFGKVLIYGETDMRTNKIIGVVDPVVAQGVATKNYVDITPSPIHGISDNTKHSGALVNDNIALGDANGLVKDSGVAISSIVGGLNYQGTWDANTNTPTLADGTGTKGHYYRVSVAGTQDLGSGNITFAVEDYVAHNGTIWQKIDHTDQVTSVFTRQGAVVAVASDYDASQIDNDSGVAGAFVDDALDQLASDINDPDKKAGIVASGSFAGVPRKAAVVFNTAMPDNNYAISVMSEDSRTFSIESKTSAGFTISSNSAVAMTGNTFWIVRVINDP